MKTNSPQKNIYQIVSIGRIQRPKGLHGQLRVTTRGDLLSQLQPGAEVSLYQAEKNLDGFLQSPKLHGTIIIKKIISIFTNYLVLSLAGIDTVEQAQKLQGLFFGFDRASLPNWLNTQQDFYLFEYIGLEVQDQHENIYGHVVRIDNSSTPFLIVEVKKTKEEVLVPLEAPYVKAPKRENNYILIEDFSNFLE